MAQRKRIKQKEHLGSIVQQSAIKEYWHLRPFGGYNDKRNSKNSVVGAWDTGYLLIIDRVSKYQK